MKHKLIIFILILPFISCTNLKEHHFEETIKGDWLSDTFKHGLGDEVLVFSFQDSICSYLFPYGEYSAFRINLDTLIINERIEYPRGGPTGSKDKYHFEIIKSDYENLFIRPIDPKAMGLFENFEGLNWDTLKLRKVKPKNDIKIKKIGFYSTGCYGTCPAMYLEIDSLGNILFSGNRYTKKIGLFSGKIAKSELELILDKVHNIQLDGLKAHYEAGYTDAQTCGIKIQTEKKVYESKVYGSDEEPVELRILFHKLMELYKQANLEQDSTIDKKFEFKDFRIKSYPVPPPVKPK